MDPQEVILEEDVFVVDSTKEDENEKVWEPELREFEAPQGYENNLCGKDILQLKGNSIPIGLVPLEKLFDPNDVAREPQLVPSYEDVEEVNIGIEEQPIIKIARTL